MCGDHSPGPDDPDLDPLAAEIASEVAAQHADRRAEIAGAIAEAKRQGFTREYIPIGGSRVATTEEAWSIDLLAPTPLGACARAHVPVDSTICAVQRAGSAELDDRGGCLCLRAT